MSIETIATGLTVLVAVMVGYFFYKEISFSKSFYSKKISKHSMKKPNKKIYKQIYQCKLSTKWLTIFVSILTFGFIVTIKYANDNIALVNGYMFNVIIISELIALIVAMFILALNFLTIRKLNKKLRYR